MKKLIFTLAVTIMSAHAFASVDIVCTPGPGPNDVIVSFASSEANNVRMFNLDITLDDPCVRIVEVNCVNPDYAIYPGSITIDQNGFVTDYGTCVGNPSQGPDGGTQPGLDSNGVTIEMGSLYEMGVDPPPAQSGDLVIITLGGCSGSGGCCGCWGDIAGSTGPDPDGWVNTADLSKLLGLLGPLGEASPPYEVCPTPAGFECMDIAGSTSPEPDGCINTADLGKFLSYLGPRPLFEGPCMPSPYQDGTEVTVSIAENTVRGGVIMENPYEVVTVNTSSCQVDFDLVCSCD